MNKNLTFILFVIILNSFCVITNAQKDTVVEIKPYISDIGTNIYEVNIKLKIIENFKIVSPFSNDNHWYPTVLSFIDSIGIEYISQLEEFPISTPEFDSAMLTNVKFHRDSVSFKQKLKVLTKDTTVVRGFLEYMSISDKIANAPMRIKFRILFYNGFYSIEIID